jgi:hypothetical protein
MKGSARGIPLCARLLCGLGELLEQGREIDFAYQRRREPLGVYSAHSGVIRLNNGSLVRINDPDVRDTGRQVVADFGQHLQDFVGRRYDLECQIAPGEDAPHLVGQGFQADVRESIAVIAQANRQRQECVKPLLSLERPKGRRKEALQSAVEVFTHMAMPLTSCLSTYSRSGS